MKHKIMNELLLINYVDTVFTTRQTQLYALACARQAQYLLTDERSTKALNTIERYIENMATDEEMYRAWLAASDVSWDAWTPRQNTPNSDHYSAITGSEDEPAAHAAASVAFASNVIVILPDKDFSGDTVKYFSAASALRAEYCSELALQKDNVWKRSIYPLNYAHLIRDICPFDHKIPTIPKAWLTWNDAIVPKIASEIYQDKTWSSMPILADALEDAGCDNVEILQHLREGGVHIRGCWAIDALMGRRIRRRRRNKTMGTKT
jgi:hypothetical protein